MNAIKLLAAFANRVEFKYDGRCGIALINVFDFELSIISVRTKNNYKYMKGQTIYFSQTRSHFNRMPTARFPTVRASY